MAGNSVADVSFKSVATKVVVCVSRPELGTFADTVSDYLTANGIHVTETKFVNVRLCVPQSEVNRVNNSARARRVVTGCKIVETSYGRTLSERPCYILPMFFYLFLCAP